MAVLKPDAVNEQGRFLRFIVVIKQRFILQMFDNSIMFG